jgi:hypothetical protein
MTIAHGLPTILNSKIRADVTDRKKSLFSFFYVVQAAQIIHEEFSAAKVRLN